MDADMMPDKAITRRDLLGQTAGCLGAAALAQLAGSTVLGRDRRERSAPGLPELPHFAPGILPSCL